MSYDGDGLREEVFDLYSRQSLSLDETSETINKRYGGTSLMINSRNRTFREKFKERKLKRVDQRGWHRGRRCAGVRRSAASSDDSSLRPPSALANDRLNDEDKNCRCPHRFTTEDSAHISSRKATH